MMHASILGGWFHQEKAGAGIAASGLPACIFGACQESGLSFWLGGRHCIAGPIFGVSVWSKDVILKYHSGYFVLGVTNSVGGGCREPRLEGTTSPHLL